ncbi:MAG TPA: histidine--tRNA ligase [Phycisphaerae bacterium]|nr:histidine--tRNA ligase [Phycisphaerae bacterium]
MPNLFQPPPGTRDFFPADMALRRYLEDTWRAVSLRHGFLEVDGPTFEFLDLYKIKSGDEIVSQLFHFDSREDKSGKTDTFALRPEFTPTLARMVAAKANALPRPIKWFSIPRCYRAERQQKGRLKEFIQWNVDMLGGGGGDTPDQRRQFDLETVALCLDCLRTLGLASTNVQLLWNDRQLVEHLFTLAAIPPERYSFAFHLLDRLAKLNPDQRKKLYAENAIPAPEQAFFEQLAAGENPRSPAFWNQPGAHHQAYVDTIERTQLEIENKLALMGLPGYAQYEPSIVRGLAYYTGFVWEVADTSGQNRALAGGGRYDKLIEMFGGPSLPATGFGMGDVVLALLLAEKNKLPATLYTGPAPDVFIANALDTPDETLRQLALLRAAGLTAITSYKATKNIGKLLEEAGKARARFALLLAPAEFAAGLAKLKNLATREEKTLPLAGVLPALEASR